jgi:glycosyltransferase involved in cell wall biosynthesis
VLGLFDVPSDGAPLVMDAQNVEHDNVRRMARASNSPIRRAFYAGEYRKLRAEERGVYGRQDALLVTSARDKSLMDADVPGVPTYIIPNGVDTSYFAPRADAPERHTLVFTGAMNYFPNADGAVYFLKEIFPLVLHEVPDARVLIVGNGPPKQLLAMAADNVTVTGHVEDVRPYVRRAAVYVVPLRMGGGTRLKVLEALAMKKPVVTTRVGCEGIGVEHRTSVLIADAPGEFAGAVIGLLRDRDLAARLASNGHELIRASYRWPAIGALLDEAYGAILARHRMRTPAARVPAAGALHS